MKKQILKNFIQAAVALGSLALLWGIAYLSIGNELIVPSFMQSLKEFGKLVRGATFWQGVLYSCLRAGLAFVISFAVALGLAVVAYNFPVLQGFFAPVVSAFRSMPVLAVLLILLTFLSAGSAPVAVAFLSLFPMLYTGILAGISGVDRQLVEVTRLNGTPFFRRVFKVYLPLSSPYIVREAGAGLAFSVKLIISAEILASTAKSLGGMMQEAKAYPDGLPRLFALIIVTFLIGLIVECIFSILAGIADKKVK